MRRILLFFKIFGIVLLGILLIFFSENIAKNIAGSIQICISDIIPSMFAMMAVSTYAVSSGYYQTIFRPFYFLLRPFFRLDRHTLAVFLISMIGGYPVGIKLLRERASQNKNDIAAAENASVFCCCISPPFAISMIGVGIYHSAEIGIIVYLSNVLSCMVLAAVYSRFTEITDEYRPKVCGGDLISAVNSASRALFTVCTVLVACNAALEAVCSLLRLFSVSIDPLFLGVFEISNLLKLNSPSLSALPLISAISAFGGLCVLIQCAAICGKAFPLKKFFLGRILSALLSAGFCKLILWSCNISLPVLSGEAFRYQFSAQKGVWILLVLMAIIFFEKNEKFLKKG